MAFLQTRELTKAFGGLMAVMDVDFAVERGEVRAIIGPNGAGKTTLFNMLAGTLSPTRGHIFFKGQEITALPPHRRSQLGIGRSYQATNIFPDLSAFENVRVAVQSRTIHYDLWRDADDLVAVNGKAEEILRYINLLERWDTPAADLAHGEQRYLEIGIALATQPELLLLDEPTAGMSPEETRKTAAFIKEISRGLTIILVEHDMEVVMGISDRITVLHYGEVLAEGTPEETRENPVVQRVYLRA